MLTCAILLAALPQAGAVDLKFIPSGATAKVGSYSPVRADFDATPTATPAPNLADARYGKIKIAGKTIAFAISEPEGKDAQLVFDANGDGDLSNDPPAEWKATKNGSSTIWQGMGMVDVGKSAPVAVRAYRFDPKDEGRAELKNALMVYADYGWEMSFTLDGKPFQTFVAGDLVPGGPFGIDRNGDRKFSTTREYAFFGKPFNFTGTTYQFVTDGQSVKLETASSKLAMTPPPPDLSVGKRALPIKMADLDGKPLDLMKDYKGKLVMVDFWATWCGPCIGELPNVKAAYEKYRDKGFDILGVSFDNAEMTDKLKEFVAKEGMPWRHVYEGKGWKTRTGADYDVNSIPFTLLVDGDTGEILATSRQLRGEGLSDFIGKMLAEKKPKN